MRAAAESYETQTISLKLAQTRVESTTYLLQAGRVTTRDLLESQDALLAAQNDLTSALVEHAIAKLSFFRDIGILHVKPDGMWEEKSLQKQFNSNELSISSNRTSNPFSLSYQYDPEKFKDSMVVLPYPKQ